MEPQPPSGSQPEKSPKLPRKEQAQRLQPVEVARRILELAKTDAREGTMLRTVANRITAEHPDISQLTEKKLYFDLDQAVSDAGWHGEDYLGEKSQLSQTVRDRLDGIVAFVDQHEIPYEIDGEGRDVRLHRSFALAEGEVAGVVRIVDHQADETGRPTDELFILPLADGTYHTVRFHSWRDEDYDVHRELYEGHPEVAQPDHAGLELYTSGEDRNRYFPGTHIISNYREQ